MSFGDAADSGEHPSAHDDIQAPGSEASHLRLVVSPAGEQCASQRTPGWALSFDELYRRHFDEVYRNLALLGVPASTREDATQDVFVVVHRRLGDFEGRSSARTWILAIARRVASRHRRTGFREWRRREALAMEVDDSVSSLDGVIENREAAEVLEAFLATLDPRLREAFVLGAVQGLGRVEMGEVMGVSPNTAYSRLRLARARFRNEALAPEAQRELLQDWRERREQPELRARMLAFFPAWLAGAGATVGPASIASKLVWVASTVLVSVTTTLLLVSAGRGTGPAEIQPELVVASEPPHSKLTGPDLAAGGGGARRVDKAPEVVAPPVLPPVLEPDEGLRVGSATPARRRVGSDAPASADEAALQAELVILRDAELAIASGDRARAVAALQAHARAFPQGRLAVDRDFMLSSHACEGAAPKDKNSIRFTFEGTYPGTPQAIRLRERCSIPAGEIQRPGQ